MAEFFGFKFERVKNTGSTEQFTEPSSDDGAIETAGGGFYGQLLDTDGRERTEQDLIGVDKAWISLSQVKDI